MLLKLNPLAAIDEDKNVDDTNDAVSAETAWEDDTSVTISWEAEIANKAWEAVATVDVPKGIWAEPDIIPEPAKLAITWADEDTVPATALPAPKPLAAAEADIWAEEEIVPSGITNDPVWSTVTNDPVKVLGT